VGAFGHHLLWYLAGALIPEFTKVFTSTSSKHVSEVTNASRHGGASLNILSGFVTGNFSAFWTGLVILTLMFLSYKFSQHAALMAVMPAAYTFAAPIFAFGLVAFGFLGMGPVTIAVDSFGPVTDNAQSVYELSRIEHHKGIGHEIQEKFGFKPDFENAKHELEKGDGAGNTFKATAKPVLIGTAVVGATTMVFGIIMLLEHVFGGAVAKLSLVQPHVLLGLLMGGSVIYWFTGASTQAVVTGAYRAVVFIKNNIKLDKETASIADSKKVVEICTVYAQKGMWNIFIVIFALSLGLPSSIRSSSATSSPWRSSVCSRRFSWQTPAVPGTTPRKSSKWTSARKARRSMPPPSWATPWAILSRTPAVCRSTR
jgi:K(+)-stimulated pyrophosphate-energized sodium pump